MASFKSYYDLEKTEYLLSQIISQLGKSLHLEEINKILKSVKKIKVQNNLLSIMVGGLPKLSVIQNSSADDRILINKIIRKVILISLVQKQHHTSFNLARIHNSLKQEQFGDSDQKYCEFHV